MSNISKIKKLLGSEKPIKDKKLEDLLGRSTYIQKPHYLIETQYIDLQKSKKFKSEVISEDQHKKNYRRNQFDPLKNDSLNKYPTHKSMKTFCSRCNEEKKLIKKEYIRTFDPKTIKFKTQTIYDNRVILPKVKFNSLNDLGKFIDKEDVSWQKELFINLNSVGIQDPGTNLLSKLLVPFLNLTKISLDLQKNDLRDQSMIDLGNVITGFQLLEDVELNCYSNGIKATGFIFIGKILASLKNLKNAKLNFSNNIIGEKGLKGFSDELNPWMNLKHLELSLYDANLTSVCVKHLLHALEKIKPLDHIILDLRLNKIPNEDIIFFENILKKNKITVAKIIK